MPIFKTACGSEDLQSIVSANQGPPPGSIKIGGTGIPFEWLVTRLDAPEKDRKQSAQF
jgi:hypothetical protein